MTKNPDTINFPNAISIGGQRCASSYLQKLLSSNPDIFWEGERDTLGKVLANDGVSGVSSNFSSGSDCRIRGEKTPTYSAMYQCEVDQIARLIPDLKIIFTIRNPVARCWSSVTRIWSYSYIKGQPKGPRSAHQIWRELDSGLTRRLTDYDQTLRIWQNAFPEKQILVNTVDQLEKDPDVWIAVLHEFLGVSAIPETRVNEGRRVNRTKVDRPIDPFHQYCLARRWLPMIRRLRVRLPQIGEIGSWENELDDIISSSKLQYRERALVIMGGTQAFNLACYHPASHARARLRAAKIKIHVDRYLEIPK